MQRFIYLFKIFIIICWLTGHITNADNVFAQNDSLPDSSGYYHFYFNHPPDSVFLNGVAVEFQSGKRYPIHPGTHHFTALSDCYYPLEKTISFKPRITTLVKFKFKPLTTPEKNNHTWLVRQNYLLSAINLTASAVSEAGRKYALPLSLVMAGEQYLWNRRVKRTFDPCTGVYHGREPKRSSLRFFGGISSKGREIAIENDGPIIKSFKLGIINFNLHYDTKLQVTINPVSEFGSHYGFDVGVEKNFFGLLFGTASGHFYPSVKTGIQLEDTLSFYGVGGTHLAEDHHFLYLLDFDLEFVLFHALDQKASVSLGGYSSNSIRESKEIPLTKPHVMVLQDSSITTMVNYTYQAKGVKAGLHYKFYFGNSFSLYFHYNLYFQERLEVRYAENILSDKNLFFVLNAGISLGI